MIISLDHIYVRDPHDRLLLANESAQMSRYDATIETE